MIVECIIRENLCHDLPKGGPVHAQAFQSSLEDHLATWVDDHEFVRHAVVRIVPGEAESREGDLEELLKVKVHGRRMWSPTIGECHAAVPPCKRSRFTSEVVDIARDAWEIRRLYLED